jgi:hypothetical protein
MCRSTNGYGRQRSSRLPAGSALPGSGRRETQEITRSAAQYWRVEQVIRLAEELGAASLKFNIVQPTARGEKLIRREIL